MSAGDLAAVLVAIAAFGVVAAAVAVVMHLRHSVRELEAALAHLQNDIEPATAGLVDTANRLASEADRAEGVLDTIDAISARSDAVSKATYRAVAEPVIRTVSVIKGTSRAARRLRGRSDEEAV